jgi:glutamate formiminotransferase/formiminotetrahydrofolate cyclodeaminase
MADECLHVGEHPRIGALDVCPFIPVSNVTMEECVQCSRQFGERLAAEMKVPVYLYEESQDKQFRKALPQIRKGEYEGLAEKVCVIGQAVWEGGNMKGWQRRYAS